jgi:hypothetical protein
MIPRAIAEPIFPAPMMPIFSFNITMPPSLRFTSCQDKALKPELQNG